MPQAVSRFRSQWLVRRFATHILPITTAVSTETLTQLFPPNAAAIPGTWRLAEHLQQRQYLLDGELREWAGATQEVSSPMVERRLDGSLKPRVSGSYPLFDEALKPLMPPWLLTTTAGASGQLSVAERIAAVEKFTRLIVARKAAIVKRLLWAQSGPVAASPRIR